MKSFRIPQFLSGAGSAAGSFGPLLANLLLFALLCAIAAYWAITLLAPASPVAPVEVAGEARSRVDPRALAELFGAAPGSAPVAAAAPSNIQVLGVTAGDARGSAVLSVDGSPARFYPAGATLSDGTKVVAIKADTVVIERNGARSELAAPPRPALAVLSAGKAAAGAATGKAPGAPGATPRNGATIGGVSSPAPASPLPPPPPFGAAAASAQPPAAAPIGSNSGGAQNPSMPAPMAAPAAPGVGFNPNQQPLGPGQGGPIMPNQPPPQKAQ